MGTTKDNVLSAAHFITHVRELTNVVDKELPSLGSRVHLKECRKYIEDKKGAVKPRVLDVKIIEEYPHGFSNYRPITIHSKT